MLPWIVGGGILGGFGLYEIFKKKVPVLQSIRRIDPLSGKTIQVVVPVTNAVAVPGKSTAGSAVVITPTGATTLAVSTAQDVQKALNTLGMANPLLTIDGKLGSMSITAIKKFQASAGLPQDGIPGSNTQSALQTAVARMAATGAAIGLSPTVQAATLDNVTHAVASVTVSSSKDVQHTLNMLGASPALTEDGILGPMSTAAVKAFQIAHGMMADGVPGPKTKTALAMALTPSYVSTSAGSSSLSEADQANLTAIQDTLSSLSG